MKKKEQIMVIDLFLPGDCPCAYEAMSGSGKLITKCNFTFSKCTGKRCNHGLTRAEAVEKMAKAMLASQWPVQNCEGCQGHDDVNCCSPFCQGGYLAQAQAQAQAEAALDALIGGDL